MLLSTPTPATLEDGEKDRISGRPIVLDGGFAAGRKKDIPESKVFWIFVAPVNSCTLDGSSRLCRL
jgi:hypothetical protein